MQNGTHIVRDAEVSKTVFRNDFSDDYVSRLIDIYT
jgi:hypothetical protein